MVAALCNDVLALIAQAVQQVYLLYAVGNVLGAGINLIAILAQSVALGLFTKQGTQGAVSIAHAAGVAVNVYNRNPGLLLQSIQVIGHAVLLFAHVDNNLSAGLQQGFQVQFALATIQLAQLGQVVVFFGNQILGGIRPAIDRTNHHFRRNGKYDNLCQRAGNGDLGKVCRQGYFTAQGVGKSTGGGIGIRGRIIVLSAAGQRQGGDHHDGQQNA